MWTVWPIVTAWLLCTGLRRLRRDILLATCETFNYNHDSLVRPLAWSKTSSTSSARDWTIFQMPLVVKLKSTIVCSNLFGALSYYSGCQGSQSMQRSLVYGDQVTALLAASSAWSQYESQKQSDLVIEHKPVSGLQGKY